MMCPCTKSGKALSGMESTDVLKEFDRVQGRPEDEIKAVIACAVAELLGGYITQIDAKAAPGFHLTKTDGDAEVMYYVEFAKVRPINMAHPQEFSTICESDFTSKPGYVGICCSVMDFTTKKTFTGSFEDKERHIAETVAFLKCAVQLHRDRKSEQPVS